ncbi:ACT domain-containing protein [Metallosphaera hakonensis]|uniref:Uncharacterized protein n=1 Tax=Metallosphaera hakonensis JCM 8857 = DSM 7519 TaxID=1293036 RepID=A0A2U9IUW6_9CREN|nr:ACT domain-containing protein [Metallosphaera hakonensis]AWR99783.1 hypothetical protein DFR87_08865 [Metallosphaera hakonensis JCM 8857 = DSM 7519]
MTQGKLLRIIGYYRDPGFLERVMGTLRKLWVDVEWVNARKVNDEGMYEIYMEVKEGKNTQLAILNLSKTVDVERVEVLEEGKVITYSFNNKGEPSDNPNEERMIVYVPVYSKVTGYSWGESYSKDIHG